MNVRPVLFIEDHPEGFVVASGISLDEVQGYLSRELIRLKDNAIRDKLVEMGWTPPPGLDWT